MAKKFRKFKRKIGAKRKSHRISSVISTSNVNTKCRFRLMGWTALINAAGLANFCTIQLPFNSPLSYNSSAVTTPTPPGANIFAQLPNTAVFPFGIFNRFDTYRVHGITIRVVTRYVDTGGPPATDQDDNCYYITTDKDDAAVPIETYFLNKGIFPTLINQATVPKIYKFRNPCAKWFNTANYNVNPAIPALTTVSLDPLYFASAKMAFPNPLASNYIARIYVTWDVEVKSLL